MSTSDPKSGAALNPGMLELSPGRYESEASKLAGFGGGALPGLPDPEQMAAWANEFFRAGAEMSAASQAPSQADAQLPSGLDERTLTSLLGSAAGTGLGSHLDAASLVSAPPVYTPEPSAGGSLYFLEHAQQTAKTVGNFEPSVPTAWGAAPSSASKPPASPNSVVTAPAARNASQDVLSPVGLGALQFDAASLRRDFPILSQQINGRLLIWLDNAATTQKPQAVIDRLSAFYEQENSNIHRAAHTLAARSTDAYERAREKVRRFINAPSVQDLVFTRGSTESINLVAQSWGRRNLRPGDEIVITWIEHHSNIVPWQQVASETGAKLKVAPVDDSGQILLDQYERLLGPRTRFVSLTHVSNALGTITPARAMVEMAHRYGARVLVDGAQAVSHMRVDVQALDADFYVFSGHKMFAPTGIGVLYGKSEVLDAMPPWQGGGNMIADVTFEKTIYHPPPMRFEAGTGNIADAVGLGAAIDYLDRIGMENVARYEHELLQYGTARLLEVPRLRLIGTAKEKAGVLGFVIDGLKAEQVGAALAREGIAVRAGHHCAQPALRRFGLESTVRPSLAFYNTCEDIDALVATLKQLGSNWLV